MVPGGSEGVENRTVQLRPDSSGLMGTKLNLTLNRGWKDPLSVGAAVVLGSVVKKIWSKGTVL